MLSGRFRLDRRLTVQLNTYRTQYRHQNTIFTVWNVRWVCFNYWSHSALFERCAGTDTLGGWRFVRRQRLGVKRPTYARQHSGAPGLPSVDLKPPQFLSANTGRYECQLHGAETIFQKMIFAKMVWLLSHLLQNQVFSLVAFTKFSFLFTYPRQIHHHLIYSAGKFAESWKAAFELRRVRPSVWNNSSPTGSIFMKFYIWGGFPKICQEYSSVFMTWK